MRCGAVVLSKYLRDTGPSNVARGHSKSREQWCLLVYTLDDCYDYVTLLAPGQLPTHQHINTTHERIYHAFWCKILPLILIDDIINPRKIFLIKIFCMQQNSSKIEICTSMNEPE